LGNQLFPLMKAVIFSKLNNLPIIIVGYNRLSIGPYLRRERSKRNYSGYFKFERNSIRHCYDRLKVFFLLKTKKCSYEVAIRTYSSELSNGRVFVFSEIPKFTDYFKDLKEHRNLVIDVFFEIVTDEVKLQITSLQNPTVSVHARLGDFKRLKPGDDFSKMGVVRTPQDYFIALIKKVREINGSLVSVSVFTDGSKAELRDILSVECVALVNYKNDLLDLIALSKSRVIITSAGSTFSFWAGFLSDAAIIIHPDHIYECIRGLDAGNQLYEGPFDPENQLLMDTIRKLNTASELYQ
jgi:hypothetical protein